MENGGEKIPEEKSRSNTVLAALRGESRRLGFIGFGCTRPLRPLFFDRFCHWISTGKQGGMHWLERHTDIREDPRKLLPDCQTIITLAYPYASAKPSTPDGLTASRYTEPRQKDYHNRLRSLARKLGRFLQTSFPESQFRVCVDSAPIMERSHAHVSGIGFIGKNNMLIVPGHGSFCYLAEILTTAPLVCPEIEPPESLCGDCTRCIKACPTGALEGPYSLDASRCLSYLTIECKDEVSMENAAKMGDCFFGCDVCQEVCPFNGENAQTDISLPSSEEILQMEEAYFKESLGMTSFGRAGLQKVKSNIRAVKSRIESR